MKIKKIITITLFLAIALLILPINNGYTSAKNVFSKQNLETSKETINRNAQILTTINEYQDKYFKIIKRNDILLQMSDENILKKDKKELKKLYKEAEKQITNKKYLKEYKAIQKRYKECDELTTVGMNNFAKNYYDEVDNLLNKIYKEIKSVVSKEDFDNLAISEKKWLREVEGYHKTFDSMGFGSIGTLVYYGYQTDMREFRILLLMLYL